MLRDRGIEIAVPRASWLSYLAGLSFGLGMLAVSIGVAVMLARGCA